MSDNAAQIPSVISAWIVSIVGGRRRVSRKIICSVTVSKTIGHDQIDHIVGGNTLKMGFGIERLFNRKRDRSVSLRCFENQRKRPGSRGCADVDVYKKIGPVTIDDYVPRFDRW